MRPSILLLLAVLLAPAVPAAAAPDDVETQLRAVAPKLLAWRRDFHAHPELGNRETRTAAVVAEHLRSLGLAPRTGIAHTGVVARLTGGRPGPRIVLRADMDALPVTEQVDLPFASKFTTTFRGETVGVMHACGHDAHTAILMAAAEVLAARRETLAGEVLFVFQPAEEGPPDGETGGARQMLAEGILDDFAPDAVFGLHVWATLHAGRIGYRSGPMMASADAWSLVVQGRQTHGSRPWGGVDPIAIAADIVQFSHSLVARQVDPTQGPVVFSVGAIKGGIRFNIIPDTVEMIGTLRTFDMDQRADVVRRFSEGAERIAQAAGGSTRWHIQTNAPVTANDPELTRRMLPTLQRTVGAGQVVELPPMTVAEDFGEFGQRAPALFVFVGASPAGTDLASVPNNHSPAFFLDEAALDVGLRTLVNLTLDRMAMAGD